MGIASGQASLLGLLPRSNAWSGIRSVCELGSQEPLRGELTALFAAFGKPPLEGDYGAADLYHHLGVSRYVSIDFNGEHGALPFDLNLDLRAAYGFDERFDLVTNFGTTEHCFNQYEVFRTIHRLCAVGGVMLHTVPTQGWGRHCFFRYDANFFEDLAAANGYELFHLEPFLRPGPHVRRDPSETIGQVRTLCGFVEERIALVRAGGTVRIDPPVGAAAAALDRVGKGDSLFNVTLGCGLRKRVDREFAVPIQGMYRGSEAASGGRQASTAAV